MDSTWRGLYAERHDGVDDIVVVLAQGLDGLLARHISLSHDELNVLGLEASLIDLLAIILFLLLLGLGLGGLALAVVVVVVVTGVLASGGLSSSQLLSSGGLSLGVQVLDLGLTEDAVDMCKLNDRPSSKETVRHIHPGVAGGRAVDIGLVDDEEDLQTTY